MQTFLPYPDYARSARVLDYRRLGKQRVECLQLLHVLLGQRTVPTEEGWMVEPFNPKGWVNHPAANMWRGYEPALAQYAMVMCDEWVRRGYNDSCRARIMTLMLSVEPITLAPALRTSELPKPPWFGNEEFHAAHRSNLLRKDPNWYGHYKWTEPNDLPYVWPAQ